MGPLSIRNVYPCYTYHLSSWPLDCLRCNTPGWPQPCRWACLALTQMMRITRLRLMTRHLSHRGFTDAVTFIQCPNIQSGLSAKINPMVH
jgi:hypothetical protein